MRIEGSKETSKFFVRIINQKNNQNLGPLKK